MVKRTEYFNFDSGNARGGDTFRSETLMDREQYDRRLAEARGAALHTWGVADGLEVGAAPGQPGLTVRPGTALDAAGRTLVLETGGTAVVEQDLDPQQMLNVPTVEVATDGAHLPTAEVPSGTRLLTLTWREAVGENRLVRFHAPWLRLVPADGFQDTGEQVVLAEATLGEGGVVTALSPGTRRVTGTRVERLELRRPLATEDTGTGAGVGQEAAAELRSRTDGGLDLTVPAAHGARSTAVSVPAGDGTVGIGTSAPRAALDVDAGVPGRHGLAVRSHGAGSGIAMTDDAVGADYAMYAGDGGRWCLHDSRADEDLLTVGPDAGTRLPLDLQVGRSLGVGDRLGVAGTTDLRGDLGVAGTTDLQGDLGVAGGTTLGGDLEVTGGASVGGDLGVEGGVRVTDLSVDADAAVSGLRVGRTLELADGAKVTGRLGVDVSGPVRADVHADGLGFHTGGGGGGYSFADRGHGDFVEQPSAGERWVWYAFGEKARLWSGRDLVVSGLGNGDALDVQGRMTVRQREPALDHSAGIWFHQMAPDDYQAFVGMETDTSVGFWGNTGAGWGMVMDTGSGRVFCRDGLSVAGEAAFGTHFGRRDGNAVLHLFGSVIQDLGHGKLNLQSGGDVISMTGSEDRVGIGTADPAFKLDVNGNIHTNATLSKAAGSFRIDHPLDPANRYLSHSFVESPEMANVYCGVVETDEEGRASVELPDYFEALNRDFRYQLTPVGLLAQAAVESEIKENRFTVRTDQPGIKVSWQVTGVRHDAFAEAHRIPVEEDKPPDDRGYYQNPVEHGLPTSAGVLEHREGMRDE